VVALGDLGEMGERGRGVVEEAQCDPAGGELLLGAIVVPARHGGLARDAIGAPGLVEVEKLACDEPSLDPPLIGVDGLSVLGGDRQDQLGGALGVVGAAKKLGIAEEVADVAMRLCGHGVEQSLGIRRLLDHGGARLGDGRRVAAGAFGRTQRALDVLGVEAHIHARLVIGCRDQVVEDVERQGLELAREIVVAPRVAHQALRAGAVALQEQRAGEGEFSLGADRPFLAEECPHEGRVGTIRPQRALGAAAQHSDRRPGGVRGDESGIAAQADAFVLVAAQDRPFDQLAGDRIADRLLQVAGLRRLAPPGGGDAVFESGEVRGRCCLA
jgi:hypothetical protein